MLASSVRTALPPARNPVVGTAVVLAALLITAAAMTAGARQGWLALVGLLFGVSLYHASFGFTAAWRRFIQTGEGRGLRAQMAMLALACALFFPVLAAGSLFGMPVYGFVAPVGVSVAFGAFLFGLGMQLGGGCASGTLFTVGGGSTRMLVTLAFFVLGSVIATAHLPFWLALPNIGPVSLVQSLGAWQALGLNLAVFGAVVLVTLAVERRRGIAAPAPRPHDWLRGPWPILAGALTLALLNFATLALAGRPWGITSGFALWGAKAFDAIGVDVAGWPYWQGQVAAIRGSLLLDTTSVMNFAIILGAMLAAGLANRFKPTLRMTRGEVVSAVIGGLLLGYGARLAFGCNIGAYFSGIASGSLHGWLWLVTGFAGNVVGTRLRPVFGMK